MRKIHGSNDMNKKNRLYQEDLQNILSVNGIEQLRGKHFLITGATGLIGRNLIDALMLYNQRGAEIKVTAIGRSKDRAKELFDMYYENSCFCFLEQDVSKPFPLSIKPDYILPLASNTHPLAYSLYPVETMQINLQGVVNALDYARRCGAMVIYPSSVEVYGNAREMQVFSEDDTGLLNLNNSRSCYTESKRSSEAFCQSYANEYGVKVKIVRLCRIIGPTMNMSDSKASSQFIKKALAGEDIVLKSRGDQYFSYLYVSDAVKAILMVILHGDFSSPYNISSTSSNITLKGFAETCAKVVNSKVVFEIPSEAECKGYSMAYRAVLINKKLMDLGWKPNYDIENAIRRTLYILLN